MIKMPNGGVISPWLKFEMDKKKVDVQCINQEVWEWKLTFDIPELN